MELLNTTEERKLRSPFIGMSDAKMMIKGRIAVTVDRQININKHWLSG